MRRVAAVIAITVIGMWLVLSFKSSPASRVTSASSAAAPTTSVPASPADTGGQPPAGPPPPGPAPTTTRPSATGTRTVTGDVVPNRYGDVQVAVVLNGSQIVDVKPLQMPFDRARSQDISTQAAPLLHDEVLQAQSAQIDTIGGATYTSDGYAQSLQSALDKARG
jgi:uncharacterized protein with FMN-binding domain